MTADIVNLRAARKAKARAEAERQAEQNRAKFGRTKIQKLQDHQAKSRLSAHLDAHRIDGKDK